MLSEFLLLRFKYLQEKVGNNKIYFILLSYIFGCVVSNELGILEEKIWYLAALILSVFLFPRTFFLVLLFLLGSLTVYLSQNRSNNLSEFTENQVELTAVIVAYPHTKGLDQVLTLKPERLEFQDGKEIYPKQGYVQAKVSRFIHIKKGDKIEMGVYLEKPENFDGFDYVEYLKSNNIYATGNNPKLNNVESSSKFYEEKINLVRENVVMKINSTFPDPHAKLLAGMIIGTREQFSQEFAKNLSISGTTHVVAVSGYNISLIINSIMSTAGYFHRRTLIYFSYFGLLVFLLLVGVDNIPALRATLMGFVLLYAKLKGRRTSGFLILIFIAVLMHIQNPYTYRSLSFQLSFAATGGLMLISSHLTKLFSKFLPETINEDVSTTMTAIFVTFPITFANFGKVTLYALLANILIAPLVSLISLGGIFWLIISEISESLGLIVRYFVWACLELMVIVINFTAGLPFSDISYSTNLKEIAILVLAFLVIVFFEFNYREYMKKNV